MPLTSRRVITVEWGDCDPAGIVFYPRYFAWFDACTHGLFAHAGLPKPEILRRYGTIGFPMVDTRARLLAPSRFGDELLVETEAGGFGRSSFEVRHRLLNAGTLAVEGYEKRVWTGRNPDDPSRLKSRPIPPEVLALLSGEDAMSPPAPPAGAARGR